jgi:hypothetical protein
MKQNLILNTEEKILLASLMSAILKIIKKTKQKTKRVLGNIARYPNTDFHKNTHSRC